MSEIVSETAAEAALWREDEVVTAEGERLPVRVYGADGRCHRAPLVLHLHGGMFVSGSLASGERVATLLAQAGAVVVSLAYPLAPENPFPRAVETSHAVLSALHKKRRPLAGPGARVFIAGEEAGGNLAAATALMARDRHGPGLAGQILLSPMLDVCVGTASLRSARAGPVGCKWADGWGNYLARPDDALHPYAAPGRSMRLEGLPPTLVVTADDDPMRDEADAYVKRLRGIGIGAEVLRLTQPTGWPASYLKPAAEMPDWADAVRERFKQFLRAEPCPE